GFHSGAGGAAFPEVGASPARRRYLLGGTIGDWDTARTTARLCAFGADIEGHWDEDADCCLGGFHSDVLSVGERRAESQLLRRASRNSSPAAINFRSLSSRGGAIPRCAHTALSLVRW